MFYDFTTRNIIFYLLLLWLCCYPVIFLFQITCKCKFSCRDVVDMKLKLFDLYRDLELNEQGSYLMGLLQVLPVQRRRHGSYDDSAESRRQCTVAFAVPDGQGNVKRVCKKTFLEIFAISPQKITTLIRRKKEGHTTFKDKRGGVKKFKYTLHDRQIVKDHINSFPRDESHYSRAKSEKEYLSPDLNVNKLFTSFKIEHPQCTITYKFYRKVFIKDFPNLSFRRPRVDTCKTCDLLFLRSKDKDLNVSRKSKMELELHHRKTDKALKVIQEDNASSTLPGSDTCTITMDLQKVFSLPKLTHSSMYYSRQLSCYNFGIHVQDTSDGIMCIWHEGQSGRGGNQMASCLLQALNTGQLSTYKRKLCVWSDNCAGQLKNRMLIFLYIFLVANGYFDTIDHKFLVSGHSFSSSDRDFALIEKQAKRSNLQTVNDVKTVIAAARPSRPYRVLDMGECSFFDFDKISSKCIDTSKLGITQASWLRVTKEEPGLVLYRKNFSVLTGWEKCRVLKKGVTVQNLRSAELLALPGIQKINESKKKDLRAMLEFISQENRAFLTPILDF